ncbi:hypothetical protein MVG78_00750 [Roseomonas gilardii subsp. gilardii]|uniref:hypothetical protein n=1 Tax=Roseomonas gilardii TaxID=257708 RepID=UPI001FFA629D|nr:hypothetical protein [Roseomonas gilardii]UPG72765.1 hypothetical protein MVG78_00750 [Roseomonas gilardii subsp. gilardii]
MANHRFQIGDEVELVPHLFNPHEARGRYTITRLLPNDSPDREYRVRQGQDGQERVVRESEMRLSATSVLGRNTMPA